METVVTTMTSTESQLKELEQQALKLQQIAEKEAQEKAAQEADAQKQAEQAAKGAQAQPAQQPAAAQPAQTQAQPAAPANNAVQAPKEESKKKNLKRRSEKPAPVVTNDGGGRQDVVEKAKGLVGLKYVWGSASISNGGFDCSGLISYVYGLGRQDTRSLWSSVQKSAHLKQNQETLSSYKAHIERAYLTLEFTLVAVK